MDKLEIANNGFPTETILAQVDTSEPITVSSGYDFGIRH